MDTTGKLVTVNVDVGLSQEDSELFLANIIQGGQMHSHTGRRMVEMFDDLKAGEITVKCENSYYHG